MSNSLRLSLFIKKLRRISFPRVIRMDDDGGFFGKRGSSGWIRLHLGGIGQLRDKLIEFKAGARPARKLGRSFFAARSERAR